MSVPFDPTAITSITRSGTTATVTVADTSAMYDGMTVLHYGLDQDGYNGSFIITVASPTTYTIQVDAGTVTPATGTGFYREASSPYIPLNGGPYKPVSRSYRSAALEASAIIKAAPGVLISFAGINTNGGLEQYILLFDSATLPPEGTKADYFLRAGVGAGQGDNFFYDIPEGGIRFKNGIVACNSSTAPAKTIGAADCLFEAIYRS